MAWRVVDIQTVFNYLPTSPFRSAARKSVPMLELLLAMDGGRDDLAPSDVFNGEAFCLSVKTNTDLHNPIHCSPVITNTALAKSFLGTEFAVIFKNIIIKYGYNESGYSEIKLMYRRQVPPKLTIFPANIGKSVFGAVQDSCTYAGTKLCLNDHYL